MSIGPTFLRNLSENGGELPRLTGKFNWFSAFKKWGFSEEKPLIAGTGSYALIAQ